MLKGFESECCVSVDHAHEESTLHSGVISDLGVEADALQHSRNVQGDHFAGDAQSAQEDFSGSLHSTMHAGLHIHEKAREKVLHGARQVGQDHASALQRVDGPFLTPTAGDYFCVFQGGGILFTAPHSLKIERGGKASGERVRTHLRERWTAEIALALAREVDANGLPASVMVWNRAARLHVSRLDPNFLTRDQFHMCPWHCALHRWLLGSRGSPLLHVDFHGKNEHEDRADCLDLGMVPLERCWPEQDQAFVSRLKHSLKKTLDKVLARHRVLNSQGRPLVVEMQPTLNGYWGKQKLKTLSHQSVLLGVPALQLEAPPRLRERFIADAELQTSVAAALSQVFREVVVPWWSARDAQPVIAKSRPLEADASLGEKVLETDTVNFPSFRIWCSQLYNELVQRERSTCEFQI